MEPYIEHLVADSVAFLKAVNLERIGKNIYTVADVVSEIRDSDTKQRLQVLPYELHLRPPSVESLQFVTNFAKKTGDYASLSKVDLLVIALTYELAVEHLGKESIETEPKISKTFQPTLRPIVSAKDVAGFHLPSMKTCEASNSSSRTESTCVPLESEVEKIAITENLNENSTNCENSVELLAENENDVNVDEKEDDFGYSEGDQMNGINADEDEDEGSASDGEDDWITPKNLNEAVLKMNDGDHYFEQTKVACLSTDFAVQNVLMHMGLKVVSLDGMLIKRLKTFVLRCYGCFKITSVMTKKFCPECGNATLRKVSVTMNPDGGIVYHLSQRKTFSTKGLKYSLPAPRGGKHAQNPILCEDQPIPHNRLNKKALGNLDVFNPDFVARSSPFLLNDVTSRSAMLGIRKIVNPTTRSNPNTWQNGKKRGGKRH